MWLYISRNMKVVTLTRDNNNIPLYHPHTSTDNVVWLQVYEAETGQSASRKFWSWESRRGIGLHSNQYWVWETGEMGSTLFQVRIWVVGALLAARIERGGQSVNLFFFFFFALLFQSYQHGFCHLLLTGVEVDACS